MRGILAELLQDPKVRAKLSGSGSQSESEAAPQGMKKGGKVSSASSRGDGCAMRGKTRGKIV